MKPTNNIQKLLAVRGVGINEAAKSIGITGPYLRMLIDGERNLSHRWIEKIANYLGCKPEDLIKDNLVIDVGRKSDNKSLLSTMRKTDDNGNVYDMDDNHIVTIPLLDITASAGGGTPHFDHDVEMRIALDAFAETTGARLKSADVRADRYCFVRVRGDSMSPFLDDGNLALLDTDQKTVEECRRVMAFWDGDGRLYIKELSRSLDGIYSVISYNAHYQSWKDLTEAQYNTKFSGAINPIGTVIWRGGGVSYMK